MSPDFTQKLCLYKDFCEDNQLKYLDKQDDQFKSLKSLVIVQQYINESPKYLAEWVTTFCLQENCKNPIKLSNKKAELPKSSKKMKMNLTSSSSLLLATNQIVIQYNPWGFERNILLPIEHEIAIT